MSVCVAFEKRGQYRVIKSLNSTTTATNGDSVVVGCVVVRRNKGVGEEDIDAGDLASQNDAMNSCGSLGNWAPFSLLLRRDNDWTVHCITLLLLLRKGDNEENDSDVFQEVAIESVRNSWSLKSIPTRARERAYFIFCQPCNKYEVKVVFPRRLSWITSEGPRNYVSLKQCRDNRNTELTAVTLPSVLPSDRHLLSEPL